MFRPVSEATPYEATRRAMVQVQIRGRGVLDERVLEAMSIVPRHEFVRPEQIPLAYEDHPLPIGTCETISQPYIVASMTQAARVLPGDLVLEVGAGAGYQAAVLAHLGATVVTIERNPELAVGASERLERLGYRSIKVIEGDGTEGYPPDAPYVAILVTAAAPGIPPPLLEQLAEGGRLVIPVGTRYSQDLLLLTRHGSESTRQVIEPCQFVPLVGKYGWPGPR